MYFCFVDVIGMGMTFCVSVMRLSAVGLLWRVLLWPLQCCHWEVHQTNVLYLQVKVCLNAFPLQFECSATLESREQTASLWKHFSCWYGHFIITFYYVCGCNNMVGCNCGCYISLWLSWVEQCVILLEDMKYSTICGYVGIYIWWLTFFLYFSY